MTLRRYSQSLAILITDHESIGPFVFPVVEVATDIVTTISYEAKYRMHRNTDVI